MSALDQAIRAMQDSENFYTLSEEKEGNQFYRSRSEAKRKEADSYALLAQAEELEKIKDLLQKIYSNLMEED